LGLYQHHQLTVWAGPADEGNGNGAQRNEGQVGDDDVKQAPAEVAERGGPDIGPFQGQDPAVLAQSFVQLTAPHVDCDPLDGAALQEAVGEAARGGASVEGTPSPDIDGKTGQGGVELFAAPADESPGGTTDQDRFGRVHQSRRPGGERATNQHQAGL